MTTEQDKNSIPVYLEKVDVLGADFLKKEYLEQLLEPLLSPPTKTVGELTAESNKVLSNLNYLGCFESVKVKYDVDNKKEDAKIDTLGESLINVIGQLEAVPLKSTSIGVRSIHTELGNAFGFNFINRNVFGKAGYFHIDSYLNLFNDTKTIDILSSTPLSNPSIKLFGHLNISKESNNLYQSKQQSATSAELGITKQKYCKHSGTLATFSGGLNFVNRNVTDVADSANDEIKTYAGDSLKESLFLNFSTTNMSYLTTSKCTLPVNGFAFSLTNELAGFPSLLENMNKTEKISNKEDQFYKFGLGLDFAKSIFNNNLTFLSNFKFGSILNLASSNGGAINFQDKFYPLVSGYSTPVISSTSIGAGSFLSYNFGINSKVGMINGNQPLRLYTSLNGASASNELNGLETTELCQLSKNWKHGIDVGLIYSNGETSAKLFWQKPVLSDSSAAGKFGFEVDITGAW